MHTFFQDLRYALRMLRKNSLLTAVIVVSLAIGIGANAAIFSVLDALLLRPLPHPHPERLAAVSRN
jgi:putative ABC transport system permease protein